MLNTVWDLLLGKPYRAGGPALTGWDMHGLKTAVHVNGTINNPNDTDHSWTVEIAIPWSAMAETARTAFPPRDGDQWRINFSRVQWDIEVVDGKYHKLPRAEHNWVWSPQGVIDMHRPERWGVLQFSSAIEGPVPLKPLVGQEERVQLVQIWDAQHDFRGAHGRYATSVEELGLHIPGARIEATTHLFEASIGKYHIDTSQRFWKSVAE